MTTYGLERLRTLQLFRPTSGMWSNLGMRIVEASSGAVLVEADFTREQHMHGAEIHRGAVAAIADGALACAAATLIEKGQAATTVELLIDFFQPAQPGHCSARGHVVHQAGHLVYCEGAVEQAGATVAQAHATIALITPS